MRCELTEYSKCFGACSMLVAHIHGKYCTQCFQLLHCCREHPMKSLPSDVRTLVSSLTLLHKLGRQAGTPYSQQRVSPAFKCGPIEERARTTWLHDLELKCTMHELKHVTVSYFTFSTGAASGELSSSNAQYQGPKPEKSLERRMPVRQNKHLSYFPLCHLPCRILDHNTPSTIIQTFRINNVNLQKSSIRNLLSNLRLVGREQLLVLR